MNIFINDEKLDARIEDSESVSDVYDHVSGWLKKNNRYILGFRVDDKEVSSEEITDVQDAERIDFVVGDEKEMVISIVHELDRYLDQAGTYLYEKHSLNTDEMNQLVAGVEWINQVLDSLSVIVGLDYTVLTVPMPDGNPSEPVESVRSTLRNLVSEATTMDRTQIEEVLTAMRPVKALSMRLALQLAAKHTTIEDLKQSVDTFESVLPQLCDDIAKVNELLQTGKEADALELLDTTSERLNDSVSAMFALESRCREEGMEEMTDESGSTFVETAETLISTLKELSDALEENDIVAAGDILEYELTEQLQTLKPFLGKLQDFVVASKN